MSTLYTHQSENVRRTWLLMTVFLVGVIALGFLFALVWKSPNILYAAVFISLFMNIFSYWFADKMVLSMAGAKEIKSKIDYPELWNSLENLCITAGLPMPKLYIIDDPAPNAFATGRNKEHAVIAVTTGLLPLLTKSELEGVLAHELSHIGNRDILLQTVVVVLAGVISIVSNIFLRMSLFGGGDREDKNNFLIIFAFVAAIFAPIAAGLIRLAISRKREFLADASGALLTRYPEGLASALKKISSFPKQVERANSATAHLYISDPFAHNLSGDEEKVSWFTKLFMTHPPVQERINALMEKM